MYDVFAVQKDIRLGDLSFAQIAQKYDMTLGEVEDVLDEMCAQEADCDDSDDGYALAYLLVCGTGVMIKRGSRGLS